MSKIFISIASYEDKLLKDTIQNALETACYPDKLVFGVVEQAEVSHLGEYKDEIKNLRYVLVPPEHSRGVCWARSLVQSFYQDEDWYFQIDAHTLFDQDWDVRLIASWMECLKFSKKPLLSSFPQVFVIENGEKKKVFITNGCIVTVVNDEFKEFKEYLAELHFTTKAIDPETPVKGMSVAAGFIFAPGYFVYQIPYDPYYYFYAEEHSIALRSFTHGWDIFHPRKVPVYHYFYDENMEIKRPHHWGDIDQKRKERWWQLDEMSKKRFNNLVAGKHLGVYGLGNARTVKDYYEFTGIDYLNKIIEPRAHLTERG